MTRQLKIFWTGVLLYVVSFFLFAAALPIPESSPYPGFSCAYLAFFFPLQSGHTLSGTPFHGKLLAFISLVISGWINPVFIVTAVLDLSGQYRRTVWVLRILVLVMIPCCWIFFYAFHLYPREGHFLWILGMLLALFSNTLSRIDNHAALPGAA